LSGYRGDPGRIAPQFQQRLDHPRIPLRTRAVLEDLQGRGVRQPVAVGAVAGQRVEGVGDGQDARPERDGLAGKPVRITRTVPLEEESRDHQRGQRKGSMLDQERRGDAGDRQAEVRREIERQGARPDPSGRRPKLQTDRAGDQCGVDQVHREDGEDDGAGRAEGAEIGSEVRLPQAIVDQTPGGDGERVLRRIEDEFGDDDRPAGPTAPQLAGRQSDSGEERRESHRQRHPHGDVRRRGDVDARLVCEMKGMALGDDGQSEEKARGREGELWRHSAYRDPTGNRHADQADGEDVAA
jgi:hypothetical protein